MPLCLYASMPLCLCACVHMCICERMHAYICTIMIHIHHLRNIYLTQEDRRPRHHARLQRQQVHVLHQGAGETSHRPAGSAGFRARSQSGSLASLASLSCSLCLLCRRGSLTSSLARWLGRLGWPAWLAGWPASQAGSRGQPQPAAREVVGKKD